MKEHNHKYRLRSSYHNKKSYDDTLEIVRLLLDKCQLVENRLVQAYAEEFKAILELWDDKYPFYFKNEAKIRELESAFATDIGRNNWQEGLKRLQEIRYELESNQIMSWLIYTYEMTAAETARSIGPDAASRISSSLLFTKENIKREVLEPWVKEDNKTFIDRIRSNTQNMDKQLRMVIVQGLRRGWPREKMIKIFQNITGMAAYKAARLIRTETMAAWGKATKEVYLENGIEYVEIVGDAACGGICTDFVGEILPLREAEVGDDLPPYHPNCACSFCSYELFDEENSEEEDEID
jgi:SPP1 gp7 family putative phage head morphogenesis protein